MLFGFVVGFEGSRVWGVELLRIHLGPVALSKSS